jgi:hypothetical protein
MQFERREDNKIRFSDTSGIEFATWTKILNRLNYLGYDMPDENSVKDYFDRHTWLNEDQSIEVLRVFNNEHTKENIYPEEQIKMHNDAAIAMFGQTSRLSLTGYVLTDGRQLKMSYTGHQRDIDHRDIDDVLQLDSDSKSDAMIQFINYGNIRVTSGFLEMSCLPTDKQWPVIAAYVRKIRSEDNPYMAIDIANHNGNVVKTFTYDFPQISTVMNDIRGYFDSITI